MVPSYSFNPLTESPATLAERRRLAEMLLGNQKPRNLGEGFTAGIDAFLGMKGINDANSAQAAGDASALDSFNGYFSKPKGASGGSLKPVADMMVDTPASANPTLGQVSSGDQGQ
jgi:hypothetical protein